MILNLTLALLIGILPNPNPLEKFEWTNRILLFYGDEAAAAEYQNFKQYREEIEDRDMLLVWTDGQNVESMPKNVIEKDEIPDIIQHMRLDRFEKIILLIGKDGGLKKKYNHVIPQYVFDFIDAMPMRREEIRRKSEVILNELQE